MTKIMESNVFELIFLNDVLEVRSHKVWRDQLTEVVTAHKAVIFPVKVFTEELRIVFFKGFAFDQHLLNMRDQGKSSYTGLSFKLIFDKDHFFAAAISAGDLTANREFLFFKVDGIPLQTDNLALAKSVVGCNMYHKFKSVALEYFKELFQLVLIARKTAVVLIVIELLKL